jgi:hypothetical protein
MRSRDGWGALHCDELQTAIDEARIAKGWQPPVITAQYDAVAGGKGRGLAPTYNPPGADIQYAVAIQSYMVHLGKDPKTGVMSSARCKAVRQLVELAIHDAKNDRAVADAAVSSSWRFTFSKIMLLLVEYQANNNKLPAHRKRQRPEEGEVQDYDDSVVQKLTNDKAQLQNTVTHSSSRQSHSCSAQPHSNSRQPHSSNSRSSS